MASSYYRIFSQEGITKPVSCNPELFTMSDRELKKQFQWHEIPSRTGMRGFLQVCIEPVDGSDHELKQRFQCDVV